MVISNIEICLIKYNLIRELSPNYPLEQLALMTLL